jgi:hypothetical protein
MSYLTIAAIVVLVLTPVTIPVTVAVAQTISDRRHLRWVARQTSGTARAAGF